ncbi:MAG: nucleotidyltransferase domain-containing protein [Candidatus Hermodarchaeota archaeon]
MRDINTLKPHHREAIKRFCEYVRKGNKYLALIIGGSIAKGFEREDSDIDVMLIVSEEDYQRSLKRNKLIYYSNQFCDYPGGYIDGKIISVDFLKLLVERGSEVARSAFIGAWIEFSRIPELESILEQITVYPKEKKEEKIEKFYAQFEYNKWAINDAFRLNNKYLLSRCIDDLILYGGRLILAHNETLYPYHRWFMRVLGDVPEKPKNFIELTKNLLEFPTSENIQRFYDAIKSFRDWKTKQYWPFIFMRDTELAWINGNTYIGDI